MHNPQSSKDGVMLIDHRASPGMPKELCEQTGILGLGEGKMVELATKTCAHCKTVVVINPWRERDRAFCGKCFGYVCDQCSVAMRQPDYYHMQFEELADLVMTGKVRIIGGTPSSPILLWLK